MAGRLDWEHANKRELFAAARKDLPGKVAWRNPTQPSNVPGTCARCAKREPVSWVAVASGKRYPFCERCAKGMALKENATVSVTVLPPGLPLGTQRSRARNQRANRRKPSANASSPAKTAGPTPHR